MPRKSYFSFLPPLTEDPLSLELKKYRLSLVSFGYFKSARSHAEYDSALPPDYLRLLRLRPL